jgi:hypothetical protein
MTRRELPSAAVTFTRLNEVFDRLGRDEPLSSAGALFCATALATGLSASVGLPLRRLAAIRADCFNPAHRFADGVVGPAVHVAVGPYDRVWKGVPEEIANLFQPVAGDGGRAGHESVWAGSIVKGGDGLKHAPSRRRVADAVRSAVGASPQRLRQISYQLAYQIAREYRTGEDASPHLRAVPPEVWVAALFDHAVPLSTLNTHLMWSARDVLARVLANDVWHRIRSERS